MAKGKGRDAKGRQRTAKHLTAGEVKEILAKEMPNVRLSDLPIGRGDQATEDGQPRRILHADAISPSLAALREKYLGNDADQGTAAAADAAGDPDDVEVVMVEAEPQPADGYSRPRRKSVMISRGRKTIVGAQG